MNEYLIGAGAVLTAGPAGSIAGANLHAQIDPRLAGQVEAAVIDFEAADLADLSRIVVMASGWSGGRFDAEITRTLLGAHECTFGDVLETLVRATGASEVHLFARWLPDGDLMASLTARGIALVAHPLEAIGQAALISGQRYARWPSPLRAA